MNGLSIAPIVLALVWGILGLIFWQRARVLRWLGVIGSTSFVALSVVLLLVVQKEQFLVIQVGAWRAPFGITITIDLLSALMVTMTSVLAWFIALFSLTEVDEAQVRYGFYPLFFLLLMGVFGAFTTGDLFNLYVWFEVMLMASFVLMALGGHRAQLEGATKYVLLNLIGSTFFLIAAGLTYSMTGTLNMADLAVQIREVEHPTLPLVLSAIFLVAFGIKAAIFPLFFWLPASYHTPPIAVTALFSGLLTKVGVYAMIRVFTLIFPMNGTILQPILLILAGFTMVTGVLGAAAQWDLRRLLSFHIISQIGYLIMGLGLFTPLALAGTIFFTLHVVIAKAALFLVSGMIQRLTGTFNLKPLGNLAQTQPAMALLFAFPALSLAGLPPFSGFFAKLALVRAGLEVQQGAIVAVSLAVSLLTLFSMSKIWQEAFWKPAKREGKGALPANLWGAVSGIVFVSVLLGLLANPIMTLSLQAAHQLLQPSLYIHAVLGGLP
ncbi:Na+/H+ antiporter subunit D [Anaerolinea sp.]|uniref:Na+/H+ antiporter subunit D n=1 Tax=Anaerolinea sp. TaxID=1872519 RepID=UPI002ACDC159|nr:Na+/H+ antiporter subunit D [Anaerolinea sp.]